MGTAPDRAVRIVDLVDQYPVLLIFGGLACFARINHSGRSQRAEQIKFFAGVRFGAPAYDTVELPVIRIGRGAGLILPREAFHRLLVEIAYFDSVEINGRALLTRALGILFSAAQFRAALNEIALVLDLLRFIRFGFGNGERLVHRRIGILNRANNAIRLLRSTATEFHD